MFTTPNLKIKYVDDRPLVGVTERVKGQEPRPAKLKLTLGKEYVTLPFESIGNGDFRDTLNLPRFIEPYDNSPFVAVMGDEGRVIVCHISRFKLNDSL